MVPEKYNVQAEIIKALAHPSRLYIVSELAKREICVCDLTEMVGADISTISKHLLVLKNAGIVSTRKEGTQIFYKLLCPCILDFVSCIANVARKNAETSMKGV